MSTTTVQFITSAGHNKIWIDRKLPVFIQKAEEMLKHNGDKELLFHLETHVKSPETAFAEVNQIIESGRFTVEQGMSLMACVLEPKEMHALWQSAGHNFFGHKQKTAA